MNLKCALLFLIIVFSSCSEETAIKKAVADYFDGIRLHEPSRMADATTPDFILYEQGKVWNNDSVFHEMGKYKFSVKFTFNNFDIKVDQQKAYANYRAIAEFVFEDTIKQTYHFIESAALEKNDGDWKISFLQVCEELPRYDTIHYAPDYFAGRVAKFQHEPFEKGGTILVGNSIIEYGNWKKLFTDSSVVNRGVAADNTFGVLRRMDEIIARQPEKVYLEIGINDVSQNIPISMILENITKIAAKIGSKEVYVISLLPTNDDVRNEYPDAFNKNRMSDVINEQLALLAGKGLFRYIDVSKNLRDTSGQLNRKFATSDGLHLNEEGYRIFKRSITD